MAGGGGDNSSWPMALRSAAHPQHELAYQLLRRNRCDLCGGTIAGEFGYRCDACNFDAHGGCLRPDPRTQARTALPILPTANAGHKPPRPPVVQPRPRPNPPSYAAPAPPKTQVNLALSGHLGLHLHQHGAQTSGANHPAAFMHHHYPEAQHNHGYYGNGAGPGVPVSYNHQQQDYPATNDHGGYMDDYNGYADDYDDARDFGDARDDYYDDYF